MKRVLVLLVAVGLTAAACGGHKSSSGGGKTKAVTISNEQGTTWTCGFNPFNSDVNFLSAGTVYEELTFVNGLKSGQTTPWLASSYKWSNANKTLTFTIRKGVKWTDGKPLTASDVLYTFNLLKKYPALDLNASWAVLKSVTQKGNQIVFQFKTAAVPYFYYIADQTPIVPQHIWSTIANPVTYKDSKPVGSGPFKMASCSPQVIKYSKNSDYWQPGKPTIETIYYPAFTSNDPANQQLASGKAQWGSQFIPNINSFYTKKSPDNHYWFPPTVNVSMFINQKDPILKDVAVRRAMAYAINRAKVAEVGEYGYEPASNQTGIVTPTFASWLDQGLANQVTYNPAKAVSILKAAGYTKKGDQFYTPDGKPLSFKMINIGGYSDWVASAQLVQDDLKKIGIKITPENLSSTTYNADNYAGKFQLSYNGNLSGGPAPYYELRQLLYSKNSAAIGKNAATNWERYENPAVDKLIDEYAATADPTRQHEIVRQLQKVMVTDIPVIPITEGVDWYQYNTKNLKGWVTQDNPYAQPSAYTYPDWAVVAMNLQPKS
ncbi:MAG TPA: ABC transporter substrate-binding protein [Gaiellaceae bacterium]